ncbi:MAG: beta-glucosidase BglX [Candidatus Symbiothrix sp.]|jgi:beta-glucosidase|nr:beta-glucosidase BglX [Candidatus Symbiothrix sp.]
MRNDMRKIQMACILAALTAILMQSCRSTNPDEAKMDGFINDLMKKMTLEEKIGQLNLLDFGIIVTGQKGSDNIAEKIKKGQVGELCNVMGSENVRNIQRIAVEESRLKIPLLFGLDVIHGYKTAFPVPLAMSSTWDLAAIEKAARIAAREASADGICWTYSPMVDICRDARWGRIAEGAGEDTFLGSAIAAAMVHGYQGEDLAADTTLMACVKHFALYGAPEAGRDYNMVDMSRNRMYNDYLPPYRAAIDAGAGSVMASFNEIDGIPATANKWLLTELLRDDWGFNGFVVSDYTGIMEMVDHGIGDTATVAARSLAAGMDMDIVSEFYLNTLPTSLKEGRVSEVQINTACRRVLEAKYKLGLFDDPYKYCNPDRAKDIYTDENRAFARKIASESFVLLKNDKVLPLQKKGKIALIGPLADTRSNMPGTWSVSVDLSKPATLKEALTQAAENTAHIIYAKGSNLFADAAIEESATMFGRSLNRDNRTEKQLLDEALQAARGADVIVAALGESSEMSGECSSRSDISIPDVQQRLLEALVNTGKPVVLVLFTGRPLTLEWENDHVPAILNVWFGGTEAAPAIADALFGDVNPGGKLTVTFPRNIGQIPIFYNHKNTGRPLAGDGKSFEKFRSNYLDVSNEPLYPFGYGLSYATFDYSDVKLNTTAMDARGELTASVTVTNTGKIDGTEVVQLYIRDIVGSITRPVKELKGFEKVSIKAGESETVNFKITPEMLKFYNYNLQYVFEAGDFEVMIGGNSRDVKSTCFTLTDQ